MKRDERKRLTEEQEAELRAERAHAAASDRQRTRVAQRFGWSGTTRKTRTVPCRDCGTPTELSEFADLVVEASRAYLAKLGEPPLEDGELTRCDSCGQRWRDRHAERLEFERLEMLKIAKKPLRPTEFELDWLARAGFREMADALRERWNLRGARTARTNPRQRKFTIVPEETTE